MWIKQRNHQSQNLLEKWAEPFSTWAESISNPIKHENRNDQHQNRIENPTQVIHQAWRILLENHPHDSICGCSIDQVHKEMDTRFDQVDQIGEEITIQSLEQLAMRINTQNIPLMMKGNVISSIVVFNPSDRPRSSVVKLPLNLPPLVNNFEICNENGDTMPHQAGGSASQELIHMSFDRKAFENAIGMVNDGRVSGMVVRSFSGEKQGNTAIIRVILANSGEPDIKMWKQGMHEVKGLLEDDTIARYVVRARGEPTAEVTFYARDIPPFGYALFGYTKSPPLQRRVIHYVEETRSLTY